MNTKFTQHSGYINNTKERLRSLFPRMHELDIKIERTPTKSFRATITARIQKRKVVVARKRCSTYFSSLEKAENALIKQILRIKDNWKGRRPGRDKEALFYAS